MWLANFRSREICEPDWPSFLKLSIGLMNNRALDVHREQMRLVVLASFPFSEHNVQK
jgi:hypothetical protein